MDCESTILPPSNNDVIYQELAHLTQPVGISDVHIYYYQTNKDQTEYAHQLWERIRRECKSSPLSYSLIPRDSSQPPSAIQLFQCIPPNKHPPVPELRIYQLWDRPLGPHPLAMFEVNLFTPAQFGAFIAWLAVWRGPLSALIHPNTVLTADERAAGVDQVEVERRDHAERAIWMGERIPLDFALFDNAIASKRRSQQQQ